MTHASSGLSVLHLLAPTRYGGLESVVISLTPALSALGLDVTVVLVVTPQDDGGVHPVARALRDSRVHVETLVLGAREYLRETRHVKELLERRKVSVLHTHGYRPDVLDAPVARRRSVPTVSTAHGFVGGGVKNRIYERLQMRSWRRFDAVVAVSRPLEERMLARGVRRERLHLVPNAWAPSSDALDRRSARAELGLPTEAPVVGWIGRMSGEKAPDVMVRAAAATRTPDVLLSMIGDGPEREACQALASELGIADRVRWHGPVPSAGSLLRAFDAVALSSWTEGTPIVLLEAMGAEVPIVSTAVGGIPHVVSEEEAMLVPAGDVERIAAAVDRTLAEPEAARRRAAAAKGRLERDFAVEPWARRYADIYAQAVGLQ